MKLAGTTGSATSAASTGPERTERLSATAPSAAPKSTQLAAIAKPPIAGFAGSTPACTRQRYAPAATMKRLKSCMTSTSVSSEPISDSPLRLKVLELEFWEEGGLSSITQTH